ncbi:quinolinate synthase NadA [Wenzhouxiangella sp. XN79A]|uniref:quinolinate synthase NadA n=1 Tax=Wenzhouxiangella sp. XN79A TaxID=2724193 RepID=UPI00144AF208|nr:quinolinate synthase NadA [Wenzhouxiangella sp. XN79A]NKI36391.1 quinolinate synthase NadA [Wenzhouxiangella sp. XN79A]
MNLSTNDRSTSEWPDAGHLDFTPAVRARTAGLFDRVRDVVPEAEWPLHAPLIDAIRRLAAERNAVILAHNYMTPEIFHGVGHATGDSLKLAQLAAESDAEVIVQAGVHFMAETAKILCPDKTVLIPDLRAGCSLAASITGADVERIKQAYPGVPVVTYVNTTAEVKAASDICCTSSNAVQVVEAVAAQWNSDTVILIPDEYLAKNVASQTDIRILTWQGACEVHERFTAAEIEQLRAEHPDAMIITHPECPPDVLKAADFAGSTGAMAAFVRDRKPAKAILITECSMSDNVAVDNPETRFVRPCNLCPHMKRITLESIYDALRFNRYEVEVDPAVAEAARASVQAMLDLPALDGPPAFDTARPAVSIPYVQV